MDFNTFRAVGIFGIDVNGRMAGHDANMVEMTVADFAAADTNADGMGVETAERAMGDGDTFAGAWLLQLLFAGTKREGVITRVKDTVADGYIRTAVDVQSIVFGDERTVEYFHFMDLYILAAIQKTSPTRGVFDGEILQMHAIAFADEYALLWTPFLAEPLRTAFELMTDGVISHDEAACAVDFSSATDGDVLLFESDDEMAAMRTACHIVGHLLAEIFRAVVVGGRTGSEDRMVVEFQPAMAMEVERAGHIGSSGNINHSASVDCTLKCGCVIGNAITDGSEILGVLHEVCLFYID